MHILIIGAGVQGIANAYFLNRYGLEVTVLEQADAAGMECSYGNGGGLTPSAAAPWNAPDISKMMFRYLGRKNAPIIFRLKSLPAMLGWGRKFLSYANEKDFTHTTRVNTRLCHYSLDMMREIEKDTGIDYDAKANGLLLLFRDEAEQLALQTFYDHLADEGLEYKSLDPEATVTQEPALKPIRENISGSMFFSTDCSGNSNKFCQELAAVTAKRGVMYHFNTAVRNLQKDGTAFIATTSDRNVFKTDAVVLATGIHTPLLSQQLGVKVPVQPAKGYSLTIPIQHWPDKPKSIIADMGYHAGLNTLDDKILRVAGTVEFAGYDKHISRSRVNNIFHLLKQVLPDFAATLGPDDLNPWAGLRPMSVDGKAIIGESSVKNLYVCTGQGHIGWSTAAASGRLVADLVTGRTPDIDANEYSIARFN